MTMFATKPRKRAPAADTRRKGNAERLRDAARKRQQREQGRDVVIPAMLAPRRLAYLESEVLRWLRAFLPHKFTKPFTSNQKKIVRAILHRARHGGDHALAAPRGEGKTTLTEGVILFCVLTGILRFPILVGATGPHAHRILKNIKFEVENNDRLARYYPEACAPIRAMAGANQRARMQTVNGRRTMMEWKDDYVIFPIIPGARCSEAIIATAGAEAAFRGVNHRGRRPDFVLIDDPETRESAASPEQVAKRELIIEQDIAGVAGMGEPITRIMLTTLMNRRCLSARFTDPMEKPSWAGERYKLIESMPDREDLWARYMEMRQQGKRGGDPDALEANRFYAEHQEEMDAGAEVSNPYRHVTRVGGDGEPIERSTLQHCYNIIADRGWDNFATEFQNDPPEEETAESNGLDAAKVRGRLNYLPQMVVPLHTSALVAFIDIGKFWLHYAVVAWRDGAIGDIIDYGVEQVIEPEQDTVELAIGKALRARRGTFSEGYPDENGEVRYLDLCLVDAGNWQSVVYDFVKESGLPYRASRGMATYREQKRSANIRPGHHYYESRQASGVWLVAMDSDHYRKWVHERFLTEPWTKDRTRNAGSLTIYGEDAIIHGDFSKHMVSEMWTVPPVDSKGKERKPYWRKSGPNHWLDCVYGCCVAGAMRGIRLIPTKKPAGKRRRASGAWAKAA